MKGCWRDFENRNLFQQPFIIKETKDAVGSIFCWQKKSSKNRKFLISGLLLCGQSGSGDRVRNLIGKFGQVT